MVLLVLTLAFSNIFNSTQNKDTGENNIPVFPEKCCDVMEFNVPGEEPEELRFYKAQDVIDKNCGDDEYATSNPEVCDAETSGFYLMTPLAYENFPKEEEVSTGTVFPMRLNPTILNLLTQVFTLFYPGLNINNVVRARFRTKSFLFANFNCGSNEAVLEHINGSYTKIDASILCKDEEDSDYTWVIVGSVLGFLALVGLVVWARKRKSSGDFEGMLL